MPNIPGRWGRWHQTVTSHQILQWPSSEGYQKCKSVTVAWPGVKWGKQTILRQQNPKPFTWLLGTVLGGLSSSSHVWWGLAPGRSWRSSVWRRSNMYRRNSWASCSVFHCIGVGGYIQFLPAVGSRETLVQLSKLPAMKSGEYHIKVQSQRLKWGQLPEKDCLERWHSCPLPDWVPPTPGI